MHAKFQAARFYRFGVMEETHTDTLTNTHALICMDGLVNG